MDLEGAEQTEVTDPTTVIVPHGGTGTDIDGYGCHQASLKGLSMKLRTATAPRILESLVLKAASRHYRQLGNEANRIMVPTQHSPPRIMS